MHAIVITFDLADLTPPDYADLSVRLAPTFAAVPGLVAKLWLTGDGARRAGFYLFADTSAADHFLASSLAHDVARNPHFGDLRVERFDVDEHATALTQPGLAVVGSVPTAS